MEAGLMRDDLELAVVKAMHDADGRAMAWGEDDCALWCANALEPVLGYDPAAKVRGRYKTRRGSQRVAGKLGLLGQLRSIARRHEWARIDPRLAQPGDVGMAWTEYHGRPILATVICRSRGWFVGRTEMGFAVVTAKNVAVAWSVLDDALQPGPGPRVNLHHWRTQQPVPAEPVSTFIGLTALIASVFGTSAFVAGVIGGAIVSTVLSIGVSLVSSLLQSHTGASLSDNSISNTSVGQGAQVTERQPIPFKRVIVGTAYVGGALFYEQVSAPFLTVGVMINHGQIDAVERVFIGTNELQFSQLIPDSVLTPLAVAGQPDYAGHVQCSFRYGTDDQATDLLIFGGTTAVDGATGTPIGNMTSNGGLAAAYDGNPIKSSTQSAHATLTTSFIGKDWGLGNTKTVSYVVFTIPTDASGLSSGGGTVTLEGSTDNFVSSIVTLGSITFGNMTVTSKALQDGVDTSTAYRYHRIKIVPTHTTFFNVFIAQLVFYSLVTEQTDLLQFRQRGIATAVYKYDYGADAATFLQLWGQVARPTAYAVVRGVRCYDPRDATQDIADETTWKWTNNATLVQAWYLTRSFGGRISTSRIRWDKIATSADWDDGLMGCNNDVMIKRHTIDGVITLNQQPFQVMRDLLTANRGMVLESAGRIWVQSSYPQTPIVTIHDRILAGGFTYQGGKQKSDLANKVQVRFVAAGQDYQVVDGPVLSRTDLQTLDGEVLPATLALNYTQDHRRAQRLQHCFLKQSRLGRTITCTVDIRLLAIAADELVGSVVTVDSQLFSKANGDYLITAVGFADDCTTLALALAEYDPTIETLWNPETDEQSFVLADIRVS